MKKITGIFFALSLILIGIFTLHASSNLGFNLTGAPGEGTCASCHIGAINPDNLGSIEILINGENKNGSFIPDSIYELEIISTHPGINKFGFALNARYNGIEFENAGTFLSAGDSSLSISDYVTHTQFSNSGNTAKTWKVKWKAPSNPTKSSITFYAAGVMANNDENTRGDKVYTDSITLSSQVNFISKSKDLETVSISYRTDNTWLLTSQLPVNQIFLTGLDGKSISANISTYSNNTYQITPEVSNSKIILVSVHTENGIWVRKIMKD
ncbi:MAG: hypothetical protein MH472_04520 [Bacteroidia bacterium]|nr:hypothetical protein [Bacteroidia bacterium]